MNLSSKIYREIPPSFLRLRASVRDLRDESTLDGLCENIRQVGIVHPLTVRYCGEGEYEILAGRRRYLAACRLGMDKIPCLVTDSDDGDGALISLSENLQRKNLNYFEEAEGMQQVIDRLGLTQEQLARKLGKSQSTIANKIRILKLSPKVRQILIAHNLTERHARALLRLPEEKQRLRAANLIAERGLNVAKTEELVDKLLKAPLKPVAETKTNDGRVFRDMRIFHNTIRQAVDMMRKSGIDATANKTENDTCIEYTIIIEKQA